MALLTVSFSGALFGDGGFCEARLKPSLPMLLLPLPARLPCVHCRGRHPGLLTLPSRGSWERVKGFPFPVDIAPPSTASL